MKSGARPAPAPHRPYALAQGSARIGHREGMRRQARGKLCTFPLRRHPRRHRQGSSGGVYLGHTAGSARLASSRASAKLGWKGCSMDLFKLPLPGASGPQGACSPTTQSGYRVPDPDGPASVGNLRGMYLKEVTPHPGTTLRSVSKPKALGDRGGCGALRETEAPKARKHGITVLTVWCFGLQDRMGSRRKDVDGLDAMRVGLAVVLFNHIGTPTNKRRASSLPQWPIWPQSRQRGLALRSGRGVRARAVEPEAAARPAPVGRPFGATLGRSQGAAGAFGTCPSHGLGRVPATDYEGTAGLPEPRPRSTRWRRPIRAALGRTARMRCPHPRGLPRAPQAHRAGICDTVPWSRPDPLPGARSGHSEASPASGLVGFNCKLSYALSYIAEGSPRQDSQAGFDMAIEMHGLSHSALNPIPRPMCRPTAGTYSTAGATTWAAWKWPPVRSAQTVPPTSRKRSARSFTTEILAGASG